MVKLQNLKKLSIVLLMFAVLVASTFLLTGCWTAYYLNDMAKAGYEFNKLIYTDNVAKYVTGRTQVEELEGTDFVFDGEKNGWYVLATDEENVFDMVFDTTLIPVDDGSLGSSWVQLPEGMPTYSVGYSAQSVVLSFAGSSSIVGLDNSHIFSGKYGYYDAGGRTICRNSNCTCPYDEIDGHMTRPSFSAYNVNTALTNAEIDEHFAGYCPTCQYVVETLNADTTYTYTVIMASNIPEQSGVRYYSNGTWITAAVFKSCGNPGGIFDHDGTLEKLNQSWLTTSQNQTPSAFRFNELVLDGYDFSYLYNFITSYDYDVLYTNWEEYYNPGDFSHMFSDLPVERITIENVKGLGEKAVDLSGMFENCKNLKSVKFGNLFENCKPQNISRMFYNCPRLTTIDLTSLDTSEVTDMSEMFAVGPDKMSADERNDLIVDYVNDVLIYEYPELNKGTPYTIEEVLELFLGSDPSNKDIAVAFIEYYKELGLNYPISYYELSCAYFDNQGSLAEFVHGAISNPTSIGLAAGDYNVRDIFNYLDNYASAYGLYAVYDGVLYANDSRDEFAEYLINNLVMYNSGTTYTLESFAELMDCSVEEALLYLNSSTGIEVPLTYDEFVYAYFEGEIETLEEVFELFNANPESFDGIIPEKEDGTDYSLIEFCYQIDLVIQQSNIESNTNILLLTEKEMLNYYQDKKHSPKGQLILGGDNSLFVINEGTNVNKLFGDYCYFAIVVTPNEIGEDILIPLQRDYEIANEPSEEASLVNSITATNTSKVLNYYYDLVSASPEEPGTDPDEPNTDPDEPGTEPDEPGTEPDSPGTEPDEPGTEPDEPGTEPDEPGDEPENSEGTETPETPVEPGDSNNSDNTDSENGSNTENTDETTDADDKEETEIEPIVLVGVSGGAGFVLGIIFSLLIVAIKDKRMFVKSKKL